MGAMSEQHVGHLNRYVHVGGVAAAVGIIESVSPAESNTHR